MKKEDKMKRLPKFLKGCFWDAEFERIDFEKSREYVLRRLLEYGDKKAATFLINNFSRDEVAKLLSYARLDPKSVNFWAIVFDIDRKEIPCLQKHYVEILRRHWPY